MDDLRRLLGELRAAEDARQRLVRDTPEYQLATSHVDRLSRAVWEAIQDDRARTHARIVTVAAPPDAETTSAGVGPGAPDTTTAAGADATLADDVAERLAQGGL